MNANGLTLKRGYLTVEEAADYLGIPSSTLAQWRCHRRYPLPYVRIGRGKRGGLVRYRIRDLDAFMEAYLTGQEGKVVKGLSTCRQPQPASG